MQSPRFDGTDDLLDARVTDTIDLHGLSGAEAEATVRQVIANWHRRGGAVLHFITGKGRGSVGGPVLKRRVAAVLRGDRATCIADFAVDTAGGGFLVRVR